MEEWVPCMPIMPVNWGIVARAGAAAHDGGGHGAVQRLVELAELRHSAPGANDAAAHQDEGTLGLFDHVQQLVA